MPLTNTQVDAAVPVAGTPSRALVNAAMKQLILDIAAGGGGGGVTDHGALTGLADDDHTQYHNDTRGDARYSLIAHNHGNFTSGTAGFVPASGGGTTNFLRADGTFVTPTLSGGTVVVQEGDVTVSVATTVDFAATDFDVTESPAAEANVAISSAIARILNPVFETATSGNLTLASHANRELTVTNASAITRTFDFTGMSVGDGGVVIQGGAGAITLVSGSAAGAPFVYAPGITASPTTSGQYGAISWTLIDATAGNQVIRVDYRSQTDNSSSVIAYRSVGSFVAPLSAGTSSDLTTLNIQPLTANGDLAEVFVRISSGNEAAEQSFAQLYLNGVLLMSQTVEVNTRSLDMRVAVERVSDTTVRVWRTFGNPYIGSTDADYQTLTVSSLTAGATLSVRHNRSSTQTKSVTYHRLSATVERS